MSVIATAVAALIEAGVTGEALVAAIARMEEAQAVGKVKAERSRVLGCSKERWEELRQQVFKRDCHLCRYCGASCLESPQCDHVTPLARGGTTTLDNLATACKSCNSSKRDRLVAEWVRS